MQKPISAILSILFLFGCFQQAIAQDGAGQIAEDIQFQEWFSPKHYYNPLNSPDSKVLPLIKVAGNKFVNSNGDTLLFRGLSITDPEKLVKDGRWGKEHFEKVKEMGTMLLRIPVHPEAWRNITPPKYIELLDQAVAWCTELGIYIIIDWHSIGNLKTELFQNPMYNTTRQETYEFWRTIARRYKGHNTLAFYELFNEPTTYHNELGPVSWSEWVKMNEDMISIIRAFDKETIPLVAGFDWAYDLTPLLIEPVRAEGIAYVTHPYPMKRKQPWEPRWEENFAFAAGTYPVIATEIGFSGGNSRWADKEDYGNRIVNFLEERGISWIAWVYDKEWHPALIKSWDDYSLTESGEFFKQALHGEVQKKQNSK
jgi:aryl-phospho-beta-D-glucosidase BglC (GH1 family)